jgi:hypothetical protein
MEVNYIRVVESTFNRLCFTSIQKLLMDPKVCLIKRICLPPSAMDYRFQTLNVKKKKNKENALGWIIKVLKKSSKEETYFDFGHSIT